MKGSDTQGASDVAQPLRRLERANTAIQRAARIVAELDQSEMASAEQLTRLCCEALDVTRASLWRRSLCGTRVKMITLYDARTDSFMTGMELAIADYPEYWAAMLRDRRIAVADAATDPRTKKLYEERLVHLGHVALMDVDIRVQGEPAAFFSFHLVGSPRVWSVEDEVLVIAVADLVALHLEMRARQEAEAQLRAAEAELLERTVRLQRANTALSQVAGSAAVRAGDLDRAFHELTELCAWALGVGRVGIWLLRGGDAPALILRDLFIAASSRHEAGTELGQSSHPIYFAAVSQDRVLAADDALTDPRTREFAHDYLPTHNVRALLDAQIRSRGEFIGVVCLEHVDSARSWTEEDALFAGAISDLVSLALESAARVAAEQGLERRVAERTAELGAANAKLRELDRMKTEFLATMSHELRTPLNSIIGFSGILKAGMAGSVNEEQTRQLTLIYTSANHLLGVINDILDVSRIEVGKVRIEPSTFNPGDVLLAVAQTLSPLVATKGIQFLVENSAAEALVTSDRNRFFQILINLAGNAVKFTEEGEVRVSLAAAAGELSVAVRDTGPGIRSEHLAGLFEAFRQVDSSARRVYEGTGLGLYLSRQLATLLGGRIDVTSEYGVGSCFTLRVPLAWCAPEERSA
jgi:signal transduction histidine kinase